MLVYKYALYKHYVLHKVDQSKEGSKHTHPHKTMFIEFYPDYNHLLESRKSEFCICNKTHILAD